jgi:hypothetical protein
MTIKMAAARHAVVFAGMLSAATAYQAPNIVMFLAGEFVGKALALRKSAVVVGAGDVATCVCVSA